MPRAKKTQTTKKKEPTLKQLVKQEVQKQLEEALLNIEFDNPESDVDISSIEKNIEKKLQQGLKEIKNVSIPKELKWERAELNLTGEKNFRLSSELDGFLIASEGKSYFTINRSGAIGIGLRAPKAYGPGSVHIRSNYPSEAPIPSSGLYSTRGLIVEGDGDDEKTFSLRAISRQNRQGFNVTSDGRLIFGDIEDKRLSKVYLKGTQCHGDMINSFAPSKHYEGNFLNLQSGSAPRRSFNFLNAQVYNEYNNDPGGLDVFRIDGEGTVFTETGYLSNHTAYAEIYEWADGNTKNENRYGVAVTLDTEGKLHIADSNENVVGVVVQHSAIVGNAGWNAWKEKYKLGEDGNPVKENTEVVEWTDHEGKLHSYYVDSLDPTFALPESATIYETLEDGSQIEVCKFYERYELEQEYVNRLDRGWTRVAMIGSVAMYKGQYANERWLKIRNINSELEHWILR